MIRWVFEFPSIKKGITIMLVRSPRILSINNSPLIITHITIKYPLVTIVTK